MFKFLLATYLIAFSPSVNGSPSPEDGPLQGSWKLVDGIVGDRSIMQPGLVLTWVVAGERITTKSNGNPNPGSMIFKLGPGPKVKTIDFFQDGKDEPILRGIYEIEGPKLRLRYHQKNRPESFSSQQPKQSPFDVVMEFEKVTETKP